MMIGDVDMENGKNVIEKKLRIQLFVAIIIYAVVGYLIGSLFSGSENPILMWIYLRIDVIYFLYLAIGFLCIFRFAVCFHHILLRRNCYFYIPIL